jgi:hypothetical protein
MPAIEKKSHKISVFQTNNVKYRGVINSYLRRLLVFIEELSLAEADVEERADLMLRRWRDLGERERSSVSFLLALGNLYFNLSRFGVRQALVSVLQVAANQNKTGNSIVVRSHGILRVLH